MYTITDSEEARSQSCLKDQLRLAQGSQPWDLFHHPRRVSDWDAARALFQNDSLQKLCHIFTKYRIVQIVLVRTMFFHHLGGFFPRRYLYETTSNLHLMQYVARLLHFTEKFECNPSSLLVSGGRRSWGPIVFGINEQGQNLTPETTSNTDAVVAEFKKLCDLMILCGQDREHALIPLL